MRISGWMVAGLAVSSCARVPKESVELSATVGRDLTTVHQSHRALAQLLFSRMRSDVDRFVDEVYAPYQISVAMELQNTLANSANPADQAASILPVFRAAFTPGASAQTQKDALDAMGSFVAVIRADIDGYRKGLLDSLARQEQEVIGAVDRSYQQLHYANSIVTAHLASVVKVHDAQVELLHAMGVERDLSTEIGTFLASSSDRIGGLVKSAEAVDDKVAGAAKFAKELQDLVNGLKPKLPVPIKKEN